MIQILTEHEFAQIDRQNWDLSLKSDHPTKTYGELRDQMEQALSPEENVKLSDEQQAWYRADS